VQVVGLYDFKKWHNINAIKYSDSPSVEGKISKREEFIWIAADKA